MQELFDEHAQSQIVIILNRFFLLVEYIVENLSREHVLPVLSVAGTLAFIVVISYLLTYLVRVEEENVQKQQNAKNSRSPGKYPFAK